MQKRSRRLFERRMEYGQMKARRGMDAVEIEKRNKYATIQNDTCVLAPDTVWGPYGYVFLFAWFCLMAECERFTG